MTLLIALLSACSWSLFDLQRKLLVQQVPSVPLAIWLSGCVVPVYVLLCIGTDFTLPKPEYLWPAAGSLLVSTAAVVSFIQALKVGQIALLMPVLALTPVISAVLSWWWLDDSLSLRESSAMAAIVALLFLLQGGASFRCRTGMGLMFLVALGWGAGTVFDKWALASAQPFVHALVQSTGMLMLLALVLWVRGELHQLTPGSLPPRSMLIAALVFIVAVSAQLYALRDLHAGIVETIKRGIGMLGALGWGVYFFQERIQRFQVLLVIFLVMAIAWLMWPA